MSQSLVSKQRLIEFYERKTQQILQRYGPGPRVHYHTGLADGPPGTRASREELRAELIAAQERTLEHAAMVWNANSWLSGDVLDVGCGLGGGAIFWAQGFGARVTAVTIAPSHIELVDRFAELAGVRPQVETLLCDALEVPGKNRFDAAVAIDSSNSFPRERWFSRLQRLLRVRCRIFIADTFLGCNSYREMFERHWCSQIGTIEEYVAAAHEAGFAVEMIEDVSLQAIHFWSRTLALMRLEAGDEAMSPSERAGLNESFSTHTLVRTGLLEGGLCHALMSFSRR